MRRCVWYCKSFLSLCCSFEILNTKILWLLMGLINTISVMYWNGNESYLSLPQQAFVQDMSAWQKNLCKIMNNIRREFCFKAKICEFWRVFFISSWTTAQNRHCEWAEHCVVTPPPIIHSICFILQCCFSVLLLLL